MFNAIPMAPTTDPVIGEPLIGARTNPREHTSLISPAPFTPEGRMSMRKELLVLASATLLLGFVPPVRAQDKGGPTIQAGASVNGKTYGDADGKVVGKGTGVSLAAAQVGAKVDNSLQAKFERSTTVGNQMFNPKVAAKWGDAQGEELKALQNIMGTLAGLPAAEDRAAQKALTQKATEIIKSTAFKLLNKGATQGNYLQAKAGTLSNPAVAESASAEPKQTQTGSPPKDPKWYQFEQPTSADIKKLGDRAPVAISFGINRDPVAIEWQTPRLTFALRDLTTDPSNPNNLTLTASSQGGASAAAVYELDAKHVDFSDPTKIPVDQESLESSASSLFALTLGVMSDAKGVWELASLDLPAGVGITDNLGGTGSSKVFNDLLSSTQLTDGTLSFNRDFSFTLTLPGDPNSSVLFMSDYSFAVAGAVPEPATWVSILIGMVGSVGYAWAQRGVPRRGTRS
jgi:hypothetical protein